MRAVLQRVERAGISVAGQQIAAIEKGLLVFLGVGKGDERRDADYLLEKIINLRIFADEADRMNLSVQDVGGSMLVVSQFTLFGDCRKGRRPSFVAAEEPLQAKALYDYFLEQARARMTRVGGGEFQAMMKVELVNDGPVTLLIDSRKCFQLQIGEGNTCESASSQN